MGRDAGTAEGARHLVPLASHVDQDREVPGFGARGEALLDEGGQQVELLARGAQQMQLGGVAHP